MKTAPIRLPRTIAAIVEAMSSPYTVGPSTPITRVRGMIWTPNQTENRWRAVPVRRSSRHRLDREVLDE